jgi:hypothetical protein
VLLATTQQGDVPLFCRALDGNTSDQVSLLTVVEALAELLRSVDAVLVLTNQMPSVRCRVLPRGGPWTAACDRIHADGRVSLRRLSGETVALSCCLGGRIRLRRRPPLSHRLPPHLPARGYFPE